MTGDLMPFVGTIGGGFFVGLLAGYAIKKVLKIVAVIIGLFIAVLAYMEYQRIIGVNWAKMQEVSQNGLTWVANTIIHISNNIEVDCMSTQINKCFAIYVDYNNTDIYVDCSTIIMGKWKKDAKEFVVGVNYFEDRGYQSAIPRPIMEKLGKPHTLKFVINDDNNTVELISGKSPVPRKGMKVN